MKPAGGLSEDEEEEDHCSSTTRGVNVVTLNVATVRSLHRDRVWTEWGEGAHTKDSNNNYIQQCNLPHLHTHTQTPKRLVRQYQSRGILSFFYPCALADPCLALRAETGLLTGAVLQLSHTTFFS